MAHSLAEERGPILVTGSHRSGSTWVGSVLALAPRTGYIHEPFNQNTRPGICRARFRIDFPYVTESTEASYRVALGDTLAWRYSLDAEIRTVRGPQDAARLLRDLSYTEYMRWRRARPVMKDPLALFSAEWLAHRFAMEVAVVIRHPVAFVASLIAAGWVRFRFRRLLAQPDLVRNALTPFRSEIEAAARNHPPPVEAGILLWRITHHHIAALQDRHPDWIFVRHEDLVRDPTGGFRDLYRRLGLVFTPEVENGIRSYSGPTTRRVRALFAHQERVSRDSKETVGLFRKRLSDTEIARVLEATRPIAALFYDTAERTPEAAARPHPAERVSAPEPVS